MENRELLQAWQRCADAEEMRQAIAEELEDHLQRLSNVTLPLPQEAKAKLREYMEYLKKRELQTTMSALAARQAEAGPIGEEELAALCSGSPPEQIGPGEVSERAALLRESKEISIRLHRSSKIEMGDEEGLAANGPEVEVNG